MKQLTRLLLLTVFLVVATAWTTQSASKMEDQPPLYQTTKGTAADPWNIHTIQDVSGVWTNECTGEDMQVNATLEWLNTGTISNNKLTSVWNIRIYGTALGLKSGTQYIIRENNNSTFNQSFINGLMTFPLHDKWRFISAGKSINLMGEFSWNLVYNAKGEEVVNTFDFGIGCN